jgi:ribose transport system ATP-binding protein
MALIAEDRKSQGIFTGKTISLNTTIAGLGKLGGALSAILPRRKQRVTEELIAQLKVKCEGPLQTIDKLSGGNQQKLLVARWLQTKSDVWLLDEPTRGVDVGSKLAIHDQLRQSRDQGAALLIVSSELEELTALCDRILVLSDKKAVETYHRGQWDKEMLLEAAFSNYQGVRVAAG